MFRGVPTRSPNLDDWRCVTYGHRPNDPGETPRLMLRSPLFYDLVPFLPRPRGAIRLTTVAAVVFDWLASVAAGWQSGKQPPNPSEKYAHRRPCLS